jgi:hypothetical protein
MAMWWWRRDSNDTMIRQMLPKMAGNFGRWAGQGRTFPSKLQKEQGPACTMGLAFFPLELWKDTFLWSQLPSSWYFVKSCPRKHTSKEMSYLFKLIALLWRSSLSSQPVKILPATVDPKESGQLKFKCPCISITVSLGWRRVEQGGKRPGLTPELWNLPNWSSICSSEHQEQK